MLFIAKYKYIIFLQCTVNSQPPNNLNGITEKATKIMFNEIFILQKYGINGRETKRKTID